MSERETDCQTNPSDELEFIYTAIKYKISHFDVKIQFNDQRCGRTVNFE